MAGAFADSKGRYGYRRIKAVLKRTRSLPPNLRPDDSRELGFAGWSLVLGGFGYIASALALPLESMHLVGGVILAVALAAAILRCLRAGPAATA